MKPQKWQLITKRDITPHKWFPLELRTYKLPDGRMVENFSIATLKDVSMIIPIIGKDQAVMVRQYKPGADDVVLEFPAGRLEEGQTDMFKLAKNELEEETGIRVSEDQLVKFAVLSGFPTKGTEKVHFFLARDCEFNFRQKPDPLENIEVVTLSFSEIDDKIFKQEIWMGQTIAGWMMAKIHFPGLFPQH